MPFDTTEFDPDVWEQLILSGGHERIDFMDNGGIVGLDPDWMTEDERRDLQQPPALRLEDLAEPPMLLPREPDTPSTVADDDFREDFPMPDAPDTPAEPGRVRFEPGTAPPVRDLAIDFEGERDNLLLPPLPPAPPPE